MPTINLSVPCIKEREFKDVIEKKTNRAATSLVDDRHNSQLRQPDNIATRTSLMMVQNAYDDRVEKLNLREKRMRKVFQPSESAFELQDMYRINEHQAGQNQRQNHSTIGFGRATYH